MKKSLLFIFALILATTSNLVIAQNITFPDNAFRIALITAGVDKNKDNIIQISEAEETTSLYLIANNVTSMDGIEHFINLDTFSYNNSQITSLNLQNLTKLKYLNCTRSKLTNLDLSNQQNLQYLRSNDNLLTNLNLGNQTQLTYLSIERNQITNIDLSKQTLLSTLYAGSNLLDNLNVNHLTQLKHIGCSNNKLKNLEINNLTQLISLDFSSNNITSIDLKNSTQLESLSCYFTKLTELNVSKLVNLKLLNCASNQLTELDLSNTKKLETLNFGSNYIKEINLNHLVNIEVLGTGGNPLKTLDISNLEQLYFFSCLQSPDLEVLIMKKNISNEYIDEGSFMIFDSLSNIKYICTSEDKIELLKQLAINKGHNDVIVNSFCSSSSSGVSYPLYGQAKLDWENNGCNIDADIYPQFKIKVSNSTDTGYVISGTDGNFSLFSNVGTNTFEPVLNHPDYFNVTPSIATYTFPDTVSPSFCITPKGNFNDLTVSIIPVRAARPGFSDATYKVVYKNQGTTTQSGTVTFSFDDDRMNLISATPTTDNSETGLLTFNFTNLAPFESKSVLVTMRTNAPTDNPAVNVNDVLNFSANITAQTDETPEDNTAVLYQTVIGSYDPNDKTCLEGDIITPDMVGKRVNYLIRFENTGTAPAENVVVTDYIDTTVFDVSSLLVTDASHTCHTQISKGNKVQFIFSDIQLPFTEPDKHGYVAFSILLKDDLQIGDSIKNYADIYFDYNLPITTNEAVSEVKNRVITSVKQKISDATLLVYPNPSKGSFSVELKSNRTTPVQISVIDIEGKIVFAKQYTQQQSIIPLQLNQLAQGTYLIRAEIDNDIITKKIVIQ